MGVLNVTSSTIRWVRRCFCTNQKETAIMKYLNVAEKNDAAKNISAILSRGGSNRREGFSPYNKIYEFGATVMGVQCQMVMTSVSGHLLNYDFVSTFRGWQSCSPVALFDAPVIKSCSEDGMKIKRTLEREIRSCQGLIIWTDCDREGENIGFEIIKVCQEIKPNVRVYRAKFSEITAPSIFRALNNLGQPDKNVSDAVDVRQELDLRTGAAFTRLQTLRLQKVFPQKLSDKLISYGSCQFPTLGFVVERYKAIEDFISEPFWKIKMNHTVDDITTEFLWKRERLFDRNDCEAILDICKENPLATVEAVDSKPKSKWRPVPLDTVEMEKNVSRKLKINAKDCMKIAEKLYTQGFISYPRTETNIFPKELNLTNLVQQQVDNQNWGPFAQRVINEGGPTPRQGKKSDQAHPPIHPTKYTNQLGGNEARLYEYIVRHFLACVHKDAQGFETTVKVDLANEKFTAKGLLILEKNYLDVYIYEKWNAKEINSYQVGVTFTPTVLEMIEGSTSAPQLLTEADLITLMEKHGIGTDATHADHIDTIKSREYVGLHDNYFVPGVLGMGLVEGYNNIGLEVSLAKPNLRAEFENDLRLICEGRKNADVVKREQIAKYKAVFQTVIDKINQIDMSLANRLNDQPLQVQDDHTNDQIGIRPILKCPKCGNDMILRNKKNGSGCFISCIGYPACKNAVWFGGSIDTVEVLDDTCNRCGPDVKLLKIKFKQNLFVGQPNPNILCIGGCDINVLETLEINIGSVKKINTIQNNIQNHVNNNVNIPVQNVVNRPIVNHVHNGNNTFSNNTNHDRNQNRRSGGGNAHANTSLDLLPGPSNSNRTGNTNSDSQVVCNCNTNAVLLTVRKDGPTKGRKFYKCSSSACNFFMWAPDENNASTTLTQPVQRQNNQNNAVMCRCNLPAVEKTVSKDGPNKGRRFYCCVKPMDQVCGFFKWCDEVDDGGGGGGNDWGGGGGGGGDGWGGGGGRDNWGGGGAGNRAGGNSNTWKNKPKGKAQPKKRKEPYETQTKAKRKCGICSEVGHTRAKCPNV